MVNKEIFLDYLTNIWFKPSIKKNTKNTLLIMDRTRSLFSDDFSENFKIENSKYILIPPGMTSFLQPLDVCINKPFKDELLKSYTDFEIKNVLTKKLIQEDIIDMIEKVWYNDNLIKSELIKKSFKICGISNKIDGPEDNEFKWPDEVKESDHYQI